MPEVLHGCSGGELHEQDRRAVSTQKVVLFLSRASHCLAIFTVCRTSISCASPSCNHVRVQLKLEDTSARVDLSLAHVHTTGWTDPPAALRPRTPLPNYASFRVTKNGEELPCGSKSGSYNNHVFYSTSPVCFESTSNAAHCLQVATARSVS